MSTTGWDTGASYEIASDTATVDVPQQEGTTSDASFSFTEEGVSTEEMRNVNLEEYGANGDEGEIGSETEDNYEAALQKFKDTTAEAVARNLEMMVVQVEFGTWLSAAKMRVNPV